MSKFSNLSHQYMPREKYLRYGASSVTDIDLLAIIIQSGSKEKSVMILAQELCENFGTLNNVINAKPHELMEISGIGKVKALKLITIGEISRRVNSNSNYSKNQLLIKQPSDIFQEFKQYGYKKQEHLIVCCIDVKSNLISQKIINIGSVSEISIHPREIFKYAIDNVASSIILIHNHPSGDVTPSDADIISTNKVIKIAKMMGIELLDHIIISNEQYYSFREKNNHIFQ